MKLRKYNIAMLFTFLTALVFTAASCKKDKSTDPEVTTQTKIQGRWNVTSITEETTTPTQPAKRVVHEGKPGYYFDFRADGTAKTNVEGDEETPYSVNSNSTILNLFGQDYDIVEFTDNKLVFSAGSNRDGTTYKIIFSLGR